MGREQISTNQEKGVERQVSIFLKACYGSHWTQPSCTISQGKSTETGRWVTSGKIQHHGTNLKTTEVNTGHTSHNFILDFKLLWLMKKDLKGLPSGPVAELRDHNAGG